MAVFRTTRSLIRSLSPLAVGALLAGAGVVGCGGGDVIQFGSSSTTSTGAGAGGEGGATPITTVTTTTGTVTTSVTTGVGGQGAGGGEGGAGASGTGGAQPLSEDCLDGVDNDSDKLVDCEDDDCTAGFTCIDAPPPGWDGLSYVHQSPFGGQVAPCADGAMPETFFTGPAGPAECTACACGNLGGAACGAPKIECWSGSTSCGGNPKDWTDALDNGNCQKPNDLLGFTNALSCAITAPSVPTAAGSCPPSGGELTNPNPMAAVVGACGLPTQKGGGCGAAKVCVPKGAGDVGESVCVRADGEASCPAGWGTVVQTFVGYDDGRDCAACDCAANATCTGGSYTFHDQNNCAAPSPGTSQPIVIDSASCKNVSALLDSFSWSAKGTLPTVGGSCTPIGGAASGEVTTKQPVTFCCK